MYIDAFIATVLKCSYWKLLESTLQNSTIYITFFFYFKNVGKIKKNVKNIKSDKNEKKAKTFFTSTVCVDGQSVDIPMHWSHDHDNWRHRKARRDVVRYTTSCAWCCQYDRVRNDRQPWTQLSGVRRSALVAQSSGACRLVLRWNGRSGLDEQQSWRHRYRSVN